MAILLGAATARASDSKGVSWVGVLQEFQYSLGDPDLRPQVRIAFRHDDSGWSALPDGVLELEKRDRAGYVAAGRRLRAMIPSPIPWTICFDGKSRGKVTTVLPEGESWGPKARGSMLIEGEPKLPWSGSPSTEWSTPEMSPVHRPLVVSSSGHCADPDGWKRTPFTVDELVKALPAIRKLLEKEQRASAGFANSPDALFKPLKSYVSRRGARLMTISYGTPTTQEHATSFVILEAPGGEKRILGYYLRLIDAGDYDGDGRSELVMMAQGSTGGELVLFSEDWTRESRFMWEWATEEVPSK